MTVLHLIGGSNVSWLAIAWLGLVGALFGVLGVISLCRAAGRVPPRPYTTTSFWDDEGWR